MGTVPFGGGNVSINMGLKHASWGGPETQSSKNLFPCALFDFCDLSLQLMKAKHEKTIKKKKNNWFLCSIKTEVMQAKHINTQNNYNFLFQLFSWSKNKAVWWILALVIVITVILCVLCSSTSAIPVSAQSRWWNWPLLWLLALSLIKESLRGYKDCVVYKTYDELRSLTGISERADAKLNDNCIICSRGDYCHNGGLEEGVCGWCRGRPLCSDLCTGKGKLRQKSGRQGLATSSAALNPPFTG